MIAQLYQVIIVADWSNTEDKLGKELETFVSHVTEIDPKKNSPDLYQIRR